MADTPSPLELWRQADGDGEEYRALMREHGYLIPGQPESLPCGWPGRKASDSDVGEQAEGGEGLWWLGWYSAGAFEYHGPWWVTGSDASGRETLVAAVVAPTVGAARATIELAHDEKPAAGLAWRFVEARPSDWEPFAERFPRADWMQWPPSEPVPGEGRPG